VSLLQDKLSHLKNKECVYCKELQYLNEQKAETDLLAASTSSCSAHFAMLGASAQDIQLVVYPSEVIVTPLFKVAQF